MTMAISGKKLFQNLEEDLHVKILSKQEGKGGWDMKKMISIFFKDAYPGIWNVNASIITDQALCAHIQEEEEMSSHIKTYAKHTRRLQLEPMLNMMSWLRKSVTNCKLSTLRTGRVWLLIIRIWALMCYVKYRRWRRCNKRRWRKIKNRRWRNFSYQIQLRPILIT